jgi:hypothetical protein
MPFFEIYFSHAIRRLVGKEAVWGLDKVFHRRRDGFRRDASTWLRASSRDARPLF